MNENIIDMKAIVKEFDGVRALDNVDFKLKKGEIRGLVGKNGAGKSTLMKIIQGVYTQTSGDVFIDGVEIPPSTSIKEREKTISMIFQEYSLVGDMTVAQNVFLNFEPVRNGIIDDSTCVKKVQDFLDQIGIEINPISKVKDLSTGDMQLVEITKAIIKNTSVILMDEPTAALDAEAAKKFFDIVRKLKDSGFSILITTHRLKDVMAMCDSVTVIRDGKVTLDQAIDDTSMEQVISSMLGNTEFKKKKKQILNNQDKPPVISVRQISSKKRPAPITFDIYPGDVVGLAGLKGSGRTEIFNNLFGIDPVTHGEIELNGKKIQVKSPKSAIENGVFLIPENRHTQGLSLIHTLYDNMLLPILNRIANQVLINDNEGKNIVSQMIKSLSIKTPSEKTIISQLSGGNQQKVVVGKALCSQSMVMLMDDPMYGVDIHAKTEIAEAIENFTDEGNAVMFSSSELDEIVENCNRILVIKEGKVLEEVEDMSKISEDKLMAAIQ